jgi:hypothetical protein
LLKRHLADVYKFVNLFWCHLRPRRNCLLESPFS